ncbi:MAG: F0F1 ATP synthase subunit gamma, partial [Planctomycetes bacterium]|nr:F0F1 ATP synthase subunit gamma [Planctomycetota bacterium]
LMVANGSSKVGIFVLNADRGLCGRYKGELNRESEKLAREFGSDGQVILGGEKARTYFARRDVHVVGTYANVYDEPTEAINILLISTSEIRISCVIEEKYAELAVRVLHTEFGLDEEAHPDGS